MLVLVAFVKVRSDRKSRASRIWARCLDSWFDFQSSLGRRNAEKPSRQSQAHNLEPEVR